MTHGRIMIIAIGFLLWRESYHQCEGASRGEYRCNDVCIQKLICTLGGLLQIGGDSIASIHGAGESSRIIHVIG